MPYVSHRDRSGKLRRYQVPQKNPQPQDYTASEQPYWYGQVDHDQHGHHGHDRDGGGFEHEGEEML